VGGLPPDLLDRLEGDEVAWCATVRPDGSPHLTPVWFVYRADTWWVCSAARNKKVRNLERNPRVALALEGGRAPAVAEGSAVVHREAFPAEVVAGFATKYGWDVTAVASESPLVLLEVPVTRWLLAGTAHEGTA
jgi:PPOX class probable F420-dependent enzyme